MATSKGSAAAPSSVRMVREKETFKNETYLSIDNTDVKCYCKCSVNYERLTYKVTPVITLVHDWNEDVRAVFNSLSSAAVMECKRRLDQYREEAGIGTQKDLFDQDGEGQPG